jgi:chromosome segregation ATPase
MDKQVVFKTSAFGGFEKKAVLDYIYRLNEDSSTQQTQLREQVGSLTAARDSVTESLRQTNEKLLVAQRELEAAKAELAKERSRAAELASMSDGLQGELARHREQQDRLRADLERALLERDEIARKTEGLSEKQLQIDQAVTSVGKLMLDARSDADAIAARAQQEAELLLSGAKAEAARLVQEAEGSLQSRVSEAAAEAERLLADARREAAGYEEDTRQKNELLRIEANLARESAAGQFKSYAHHVAQIQSAIADLMSSYEEKTAEISRLVEVSGRAFEKTADAIEGADLSLRHEQLDEPAPAFISTEWSLAPKEGEAPPEEGGAPKENNTAGDFFRADADDQG